MADKYPINLWVNEERYKKLEKAGLAGMCQEMLAGLKCIQVFCNDAERDKVLKFSRRRNTTAPRPKASSCCRAR